MLTVRIDQDLDRQLEKVLAKAKRWESKGAFIRRLIETAVASERPGK